MSNLFDDFDTQRQCDEVSPEEIEWEEEFLKWFNSQLSPWKVYEVSCDDSTHGDLIYEWTGRPEPHA